MDIRPLFGYWILVWILDRCMDIGQKLAENQITIWILVGYWLDIGSKLDPSFGYWMDIDKLVVNWITI